MAEYVKRRQKPVKEDARVTKTKERLRESLLDLMEDKPLADISITALCASAHVNRNTFYAHYGSPADVLDELMADLGSAVAHSLAVTRRHGSVAWLTELCENVQENQHAYEMLFATSDGRTYIEREILSAYKLVMDSTAERIRRNPRCLCICRRRIHGLARTLGFRGGARLTRRYGMPHKQALQDWDVGHL